MWKFTHLCIVTNEFTRNPYNKDQPGSELIDAYDRFLICYKVIQAQGEPAWGWCMKKGRLEGGPGAELQLPHPESFKFRLHFFICKMAIPVCESREKNLHAKVCKVEKAIECFSETPAIIPPSSLLHKRQSFTSSMTSLTRQSYLHYQK